MKYISFNDFRCSSVVRAFANGAMSCLIDPSFWTNLTISRSSQCSTTGATKDVICVILSVGWCVLKYLAANRKE